MRLNVCVITKILNIFSKSNQDGLYTKRKDIDKLEAKYYKSSW